MPRLMCRNKVCARLLCLAEKFGFPDDFAGCCSFTVFFLEGRAVFALSFFIAGCSFRIRLLLRAEFRFLFC